MKKLTILLIVFFAITEAKSQNYSFSGIVNNSTTWDYDTIEINGNVEIPDNITLTIEKNTRIIMNGNYHWLVNGCIKANGDEGDTIVFSINDNTNFWDTSTLEGGWGGINLIEISNNNDTSIFKYCKFEYGKALCKSNTDSIGGTIYIENSTKVLIHNCLFSNNLVQTGGGAIGLYNHAFAKISDNYFSNNRVIAKVYKSGGGAIYCDYYSNPKISNNIFNNNYSSNNGGAVRITEYSTPVLSNNAFIYNIAMSAGGAIYISSDFGFDSPLIVNNLIACNTANTGGSGVYESSLNTHVINNLIFNNTSQGIFGGHDLSYSVYANNIITSNGTGIEVGSFHIVIFNNIVWGNRSSDKYKNSKNDDYQILNYNHQGASLYNVKYCIVENGYQGEGNSDIYPSFINYLDVPGLISPDELENCDWRLADTSIAINNGNLDTSYLHLPSLDFDGNPRIYGGRIDIGAFENQEIVTLFKKIKKSEHNIEIFPNPTTDYISINTSNNKIIKKIEIYNSLGKEIMRINSSIDGRINMSNLPSDIYFLYVTTDEAIFLEKIVKQ